MRILLRKFLSNNNFSFTPKNWCRYASSKDKKAKEEEVVIKTEEIKKNVKVENHGPITVLNIDRQRSRNSLDEATMREMTAAIEQFEKDQNARVLILHGEGGSFCSGFDIDEIDEKGYNTLKDAGARFTRRPLCDKPTIAAVAGYAVGEGFELALACDLRVIEDTSVLGCLGRRFGAPQAFLGARRMTALIGLAQSLDLLMTGRLIDGREANIKGLASKLTSTGTALGEAMKLGKSLTKFPQNALIMDKLAATFSQLDENSEERMRDEAVLTSLAGNAIEDLKEGVKKFQRGIGKHGKFYKLTEVPLKDWEIEETLEEIQVKIDKSKKT